MRDALDYFGRNTEVTKDCARQLRRAKIYASMHMHIIIVWRIYLYDCIIIALFDRKIEMCGNKYRWSRKAPKARSE